MRSTVAPFGIRPTVGVLITTLLPSRPCAPKPPTIKLPCAIAYTLPSTPFKKVCSKVPPRKLPALPIEETVISIVCPGFLNAGNSACTATAATFLILGL